MLRIVRTFLWAVCAASLLVACDLPPDELTVDSETASWEDSDTGTDSDTETEVAQETHCVKAVLCSVFNPEEMLACFEGLDEDDQAAALDISLCAAASCLDVAGDLPNFGICLVQNCGPEAMECVRTSIAGALL